MPGTLVKRVTKSWSYARSGGGVSHRGAVMGAWALMKVEESLTDSRYQRNGLLSAGRDWDLHGAGSPLSGYVATPWRSLRAIFKSWQPTPDDVLLDYGSGKGRTIVWAAANFRLRRIVGVELDGQLHKDAQANLDRWKGARLCPEVELVQADATTFEVPDDVTAIFFGNPFKGAVFDSVLDRILESLDRNPRELTVLYYHPTMHDSLAGSGFAVERQQAAPPYSWTTYRRPVPASLS